jgi:hypothetical protein
MMGRQDRDQGRLFYEFNLDDVIARSHLLRGMNVFVTAALDDLHQQLGAYYSVIGRPSASSISATRSRITRRFRSIVLSVFARATSYATSSSGW